MEIDLLTFLVCYCVLSGSKQGQLGSTSVKYDAEFDRGSLSFPRQAKAFRLGACIPGPLIPLPASIRCILIDLHDKFTDLLTLTVNMS